MTEPFSIEEAILHGDDCPKYTARDMQQAVAAERERLRGYFRDALADHGITWPGEVDILYDKCFGAGWLEDA